MRNKFTTKQWIRIDFIFLLIILVFTFIIIKAPSYDINSLSPSDRILAEYGAYNAPLPLWKTICLYIDIFLLIIFYFIYFAFCRCPFCTKQVHSIRGGFCHHCSQSLDFTKAEASKIKNSK